MIKLKDLIKQNDCDCGGDCCSTKESITENKNLKRGFGEPLPTLQDVANKHNNITEDDCGCNETTSCGCSVKEEMVIEGPDDVRKAKKELQRVIKAEAKLRERMMKLEQIFLDDPRPENMKLAKDIKKSYKDNVTKFMRDTISYVKKMK